MSNRKLDFQNIEIALGESVRASSTQAMLVEGDSLALLRQIPGQSISLILTDPPYHSTKKQNIYGDTAFEEDKHYLEWMTQYAMEWRRVLKSNGSLFCFCASSMAARLEVIFSKDFNILSQIVWTKPNDPGFDGWKQKMKKEALRQWYPHTERIIFAEPASDGNLHRSPFGHYLKEIRIKAGMSAHELAEKTGLYGRINHGGTISNWEAGRNVPSREQYEKVCAVLLSTGKIESILPYEDAVRPFIMDSSKEFTDVWNFPSVRPYRGKHPAEKPAALLEHAVQATTYPGDIVLDCFGGSGSTAIAAVKLGRRAIAIEIDPVWVSRMVARLEIGNKIEQKNCDISHVVTARPEKRTPQLGLFLGVK